MFVIHEKVKHTENIYIRLIIIEKNSWPQKKKRIIVLVNKFLSQRCVLFSSSHSLTQNNKIMGKSGREFNIRRLKGI